MKNKIFLYGICQIFNITPFQQDGISKFKIKEQNVRYNKTNRKDFKSFNV